MRSILALVLVLSVAALLRFELSPAAMVSAATHLGTLAHATWKTVSGRTHAPQSVDASPATRLALVQAAPPPAAVQRVPAAAQATHPVRTVCVRTECRRMGRVEWRVLDGAELLAPHRAAPEFRFRALAPDRS